MLRLTFARGDAGRQFDILLNGQVLANVTLTAHAKEEIYTVDYSIPEELRKSAKGRLVVQFVAKSESLAGKLYGLHLLR